MKPQFMKFKLPADLLTRPGFETAERIGIFIKILNWMSPEPRQRLIAGRIVNIPPWAIVGPSRALSQELDINRNMLYRTISFWANSGPLLANSEPAEIAATLRNPLEFSIEVKESEPKLSQSSRYIDISIIYNKELNIIYNSYPRKIGKTPGLKKLSGQIKTPEDLQLFEKAVKNYSAHVKHEQKEPQYVLHFSTFAGQWRDWIDFQLPKSKIEIISLSTP